MYGFRWSIHRAVSFVNSSKLSPVSTFLTSIVYSVIAPLRCSGSSGSHVSRTEREEIISGEIFRGGPVGAEIETVIYIY